MDKFEKIAEIRISNFNSIVTNSIVKKEIIEAFENKEFYICLEEDYGPDGCEFILMKKTH